MRTPRFASIAERSSDPAERLVSVLLAIVLSIALFAMFRPAP